MEENQKKSKSEKLQEKINDLIEKIENEENPNKRALYSIKASMVLERINEELELQEAIEKIEDTRQKNQEVIKDIKSDIRNEILRLSIKVNYLKSKIEEKSRYDADSKDFILKEDKDEILSQGSVNQYLDNVLRTSGKPEQEDIADEIENVEKLKSDLAQAEIDLENKSALLNEMHLASKNDDKFAKNETTALVIKSKVNVFSKVANFFKNVKDNIKRAWQENREIREAKEDKKIDVEIAKENKKDEKEIARIKYEMEMRKLGDKPKIQQLVEIKQRYDAKIAEIERKYEQKEIQLNYGSKKKQENIKSQNAKEQANEFREALKVKLPKKEENKSMAEEQQKDLEEQEEKQDDNEMEL